MENSDALLDLTVYTPEVSFETEADKKEEISRVYPCVVIDGLTTKEEFYFFRDNSVNTINSLPLYTNALGQCVELGTIDLTFQNLLALKIMFNYRIRVCFSDTEEKIIDLNNPEHLEQFIAGALPFDDCMHLFTEDLAEA